MSRRVIVVQGAPGVGKTTLARKIAASLGYKLISKDQIKEALFETLGSPADRHESESYGRMAIRAMYAGMEELYRAEKKVMIECPLVPEYAIRELAVIPKQDILQLYLSCDPAVHTERFRVRSGDGSRHSGHGDERIDAVAAKRRNAAIPNIDTIYIDTTHFSDADITDLILEIKEYK